LCEMMIMTSRVGGRVLRGHTDRYYLGLRLDGISNKAIGHLLVHAVACF